MERLEAAIAKTFPCDQWRGVTVLVGVSGGPDSVALLRALNRLQDPSPGRLVVAHFEHGWRPGAGKEDMRFVRSLAKSLGLVFRSGNELAGGTVSGLGREARARAHRFAFFEEVGRDVGARFLALGHTRDDQVETILHRLIRGTGPVGLAGIPRVRPWFDGASVVHPMLDVPRREVLAYLDRLGQSFRTDSTNDDLGLTRNRIRWELLPLLRSDFNAQVDEAIGRLGEWGELYREWLARELEPVRARAVARERPDRVELDCRELANEPRLVVLELLRQLWQERNWPRQGMSSLRWKELADMVLKGGDGRRQFPGGIEASRHGECLELGRPCASEPRGCLDESPCES